MIAVSPIPQAALAHEYALPSCVLRPCVQLSKSNLLCVLHTYAMHIR